jgi:hypothetical protein
VEYLLEVPPQSERVMTFSYQILPPDGLVDARRTYAFLVEKQPGTQSIKTKIDIHYPSGWTVVDKSSLGGEVAGVTTLVNTGQITYNSTLSTDQKFDISFQK